MSRSLVVTIMAQDRAGLVAELSDVAMAHGANWLDSRMATLAGRFAGIVHLEVENHRHAALTAALDSLEHIVVHAESGIEVAGQVADTSAIVSGANRYRLEIVGLDHPGIVRDISDCLARHAVGIEALDTERFDGSMSGERMFRALATLSIPDSLALDELHETLETLSNSLVVDTHLLKIVEHEPAVR